MYNVFPIRESFEPRSAQIRMAQVIKRSMSCVLIEARQVGKTQLITELNTHFMIVGSPAKNPIAIVGMQSHENAFATHFERLHENLKTLPASVYSVRGGSNKPITVKFVRPWLDDRCQITFTGVQNAQNARGRSPHLIVLDEMAFYPPDIWLKVFSPMLKDTRGRAILTSTVNGRNHFHRVAMMHKQKQERGVWGYGYLNENIYESGLYTKAYCDKIADEYRSQGKYHIFRQEYLNDWDAMPTGTYILGDQINRMRETGKIVSPTEFDRLTVGDEPWINFCFDIGLRKNLRAVAWRKMWKTLYLYQHYEGSERVRHLLELIPVLYKDYHKYNQINLFLPHDAGISSMKDGIPLLQDVQDLIYRMGFQRKMRVYCLEIIRNTMESFRSTITMFDGDVIINQVKFGNGLDYSQQCRWYVDPQTGMPQFGKPVRNEGIHTFDVYRYIDAAIKNKLDPQTQDKQHLKRVQNPFWLDQKIGRAEYNYLCKKGNPVFNYLKNPKGRGLI